jgi:hypothetical protein
VIEHPGGEENVAWELFSKKFPTGVDTVYTGPRVPYHEFIDADIDSARRIR